MIQCHNQCQGDMIAGKISATKRSHSDIHDVTLSTIGGDMTIDLLVADDAFGQKGDVYDFMLFSESFYFLQENFNAIFSHP
ncbi:MAG: hypothetical protein OMM_09544 [Candidatus Magnetoglobus multicellularis str. Araruama]|uniref:Uncharacterized protein n=1 Tax=Candidatus Magnetoglobus multicellularis str. Araruama TaxID=890399 RepID=A0A1V1P3Y0_9BACT|nr:MAG: hypothetical protein OMM_09544 [Candidatus Magnetoglobus multicellularis str. Araruama]